MRQAALTLGSAPDCGTFIYTLKVPHTHPPMPKSKGLTRPGFAMQSYVVIVSSTLGSAPDCRTFIYTLKVLHTHHHKFKFSQNV